MIYSQNLVLGIVQMGVEDLLREGERPLQPRLDDVQVVHQLFVGHHGLLVELGHGDGGRTLRRVELARGQLEPQALQETKRRSTEVDIDWKSSSLNRFLPDRELTS